MITGTLAVIFGIAMIAAANNGEWGSVGIGAVIIVILLSFGMTSRKYDRACNNFVDYWADGRRPDGSDADATEILYEPVQPKVIYPQYHREAFQCPECGKHVQAVSTLTNVNGVQMWQFNCPQCGTMIRRIGH